MIPPLIKLQSLLSKTSPKSKVVIVGGFVRDQLLNIESKDVDAEVYGVPFNDLVVAVKQVFGKNITMFETIGSIKIDYKSWVLEIALPRTETKTGSGHKGFSILPNPDLDFKTASQRRDFTINSLGLDVGSGKILDPFGGQKDLKQKILRVVNPKTFTHDPVRLLRACQFTARFELAPEPKTLTLLKKIGASRELKLVSGYRDRDMWTKLLSGKKPSLGLQLMLSTGLLKTRYPELYKLTQTKQPKKWHPEGTVFVHTCMALDALATSDFLPRSKRRGRLETTTALAVLCHDLGKPLVHQKHYPLTALGHDKKGNKPTIQFLTRLELPKLVKSEIAKLVMHHLRPRELYEQYAKETNKVKIKRHIAKLKTDIQPASLKELLLVAKADAYGKGNPQAHKDWNNIEKWWHRQGFRLLGY